jgi:hypothetical protein
MLPLPTGTMDVRFARLDRRFHDDKPAAISTRLGVSHLSQMNRSCTPRRARYHDAAAIPFDLYDYAATPDRKPGRPVKHDLIGWRVIDDWPERVPITEREVDVFEAWFGDIFDELFGPP